MMAIAYIIGAISVRLPYSVAFSTSTTGCYLHRTIKNVKFQSSSITTISSHQRERQSASPFASATTSRLHMSTSSEAYIMKGISRIETLQTLLSLHGAPGSSGCSQPDGDLQPIPTVPFSQLVAENNDLLDLHPHLYPIAKSQSTGRYICGLRRPSSSTEDGQDHTNPNSPLPIVEGGIDLPGMKLLALNSELLMRRIAAEADHVGGDKGSEIVEIYNDGLGEGKLIDSGLDTLYESGSVEKLGYGPEKYALLRIGPFPDLYENMTNQHMSRNDEASALIAAEAANGKFTGFGSTFAFYSQLLSTLPNREDESKDAARVCLRLPLPSVALTREDLANVSRNAGLAADDDGIDECMTKMQDMYEKIRRYEQDQEDSDSGKTAEQIALDEANYLIDTAALTGRKWREIREELAEIYGDAGQDNMAEFVNPKL